MNARVSLLLIAALLPALAACAHPHGVPDPVPNPPPVPAVAR